MDNFKTSTRIEISRDGGKSFVQKGTIVEKNLLSELGYGLNLTSEAHTSQKILPHLFYYFLPQKGLCLDLNSNLSKALCFSGKSLLALAYEDFSDETVLSEMKQLLRLVIADLLGRKTLKSRDLFSGNNYETT